MSDLLHEIAEALKNDYGFKPSQSKKHLQKGKCPSCGEKSLWTFADTPWVIRCERLNNCGFEEHAKDLYPDLFNSWTERYQAPEQAKPQAEQNPHAAADAYLRIARGFDLALIAGTYTQETYFDPKADSGRGAGTSTVRFKVAESWWERLIDRPWRFGKKKANFAAGKSYAGFWWEPPHLTFFAPTPETPADAPKPPMELWLVEGIFDAISLAHHGIAAAALMSCNNYPGHALESLRRLLAMQGHQVPEPKLVWALDGDKAGRDFTRRHVERARADGWACEAAQIPQRENLGKVGKRDWNDLHQRGLLEPKHIEEYRHQGALLLADSAEEKALLIYNRTGRTSFDMTFDNRLYWFTLDLEAYGKARETIEKAQAKGDCDDEKAAKLLDESLRASKTLAQIANCRPEALYYQANPVTDEAWYYFRVSFPDDRAPIKGTFTAGQLTTSSEFEKRLLHMAPGAMFSGSSQQLKRLMQFQLENPKVVQTVDFVGYTAAHKAYILGKVAVRNGEIHEANAEDYFDFDRLAIKSLQKSINLQINTDRDGYDRSWTQHLWAAFGAKGYIALAFWFGTLFAEQIRAEHQSFPFLEIVGEPGAGKSTLIQFLWKLLGRDYEGFDPAKSTSAGRLRTFTQVSGLPIVLIESDRETKNGNQAHVRSFDWDELKDAYNGNPIRTTGVKTGGNETYDPPFRASIVISQNNQVQASQAVMERICHMTFSAQGHTPTSYEHAKALEKVAIEQVSGFILAALRREAEAMKVITETHDANVSFLLDQDGVHKPRIAKNHAQLLSIAQALRAVVRITDEQFALVKEQVVAMARERQQSINADHPLVQDFWEAFDYLNGLPLVTTTGPKEVPRLNHSRDTDFIAVNLNEFVEMASAHRQQVPPLGELKKVLRTSKTRSFSEVKTVNSAIKTRNEAGSEVGRTVHCWVFRAPGASRRT
ncbi:toprim domain-containing protein [Acidovorax sp. SUPP1855]|uniref:toprim domain-containing protein n=1 Tax=Acidovorax sp. SUPP1855 TaxID=431774 RepID=UPI0023DE2AA5|nr:toprim domain-containing protein [Acidovorax sp. SUPP1855]GKS83241.1 toprim domain-containing protein [Acidovorax sp. SUPP1855]